MKTISIMNNKGGVGKAGAAEMRKRRGKTVAERMAVSLRRDEAEATGKPLYASYADVPPGLYSKTACMKLKRPAAEDEAPAAYVLNRNWLGYMPLYDRREKGGQQG